MKLLILYYHLANNIMITILLVILTFLALLISNKKKLLTRNHVNLPPGKFGLPVIGETIRFISSSRKGYLPRFMVERMNRYYHKVFKTSLFGEKMAVFCDAPGNKFVFSNENKLVKAWLPGSLSEIIFPSLETSFEEEMLTKGKLLYEFLTPQAIHRYVEMMDRTTKQHMDSEWVPNSKIVVYPVTKRLGFSIGCCIFMGMDYASAEISRMESQFDVLSEGFYTLPINFPGTAFRRAIKAADIIRSEIQTHVRTMKQQTSSPSAAGYISYLSRLLSTTDEEGKLLSDWDIANRMLSAFIASHENIGSLLTNIVFYLADHPQVYDLALKEQIEIKSLKGGKTLLTWEDTKRMKYCQKVVNEVLRISPPSFGFFRDVLHDISYEGFTIPKGWKILCSTISAHNNPEYYPNPEKFDPSRFDGNGPPPYSFIPFGGGPRMCPGYEYARQTALVFLHNLLINFKWEKLIAKEKIILAPFAFPAHGLPIKLQQRGDDAGTH